LGIDNNVRPASVLYMLEEMEKYFQVRVCVVYATRELVKFIGISLIYRLLVKEGVASMFVLFYGLF